jgi:glycosyltransferase involved in cell wall biosynthesis
MSHLLQVLPSVVLAIDGELQIEVDFCEGLRIYLERFDSITVACPVTTEIEDSGLRKCRPFKELPWGERVRFLPLPYAYNWRVFLRTYRSTRQTLSQAIADADYLVFSPHSLVGDWPIVSAREAVRRHRSFVVEADVVYERVASATDRSAWWKRLIKRHVLQPAFQRAHRYTLKNSALALFQGQDVFGAYAPYAPNPYKVYHMPISGEDYITDTDLDTKCHRTGLLRLCYVGRAIEMKGPTDWLRILQELKRQAVDFHAVWLGDGSLLSQMKEFATNFGLAHQVEFPGFVNSRADVLRTMRRSDIFLFCHKTPESPRCLIEALASGCPLVGYRSAYPEELTADHGGGQFSDIGDWQGVAKTIVALSNDRARLAHSMISAAQSGRRFDRDNEMRRRVDLIVKYAGPA